MKKTKLNPEWFLNKDFIVYNSQFLAWFNYDKTNRKMLLVLRTGKQYIYENVPVKTYNEIIQSQNKGSVIHQQIILKAKGQQLPDIIPPADIQQKLKPPAVNKWLAQ